MSIPDSKAQQQRSLLGYEFQKSVTLALLEAGLDVHTEVPMTHDGVLLAGAEARKRALACLDIVVCRPDTELVGSHIGSCAFVSCKRSVRERWLEDSWTLHTNVTKPVLYALVTQNDFPNPQRFREDLDRLLVTDEAPHHDKRRFPHTVNSMVCAIKAALMISGELPNDSSYKIVDEIPTLVSEAIDANADEYNRRVAEADEYNRLVAEASGLYPLVADGSESHPLVAEASGLYPLVAEASGLHPLVHESSLEAETNK